MVAYLKTLQNLQSKGGHIIIDGLEIVTDPNQDRFDFLTQISLARLVKNQMGPGRVRQIPGPDYLGQLTLVTNVLTLEERTYKNGKPEHPLVKEGFQRLAELFKIDIPLGDL